MDEVELPQVRDVSDRARREFESFFQVIPSSKDLVIQSKSLMSLLEHVTPMKVLRSLQIDHIYLLEPSMHTGGPIQFYLTRPEIAVVNYIVDHIKLEKDWDSLVVVTRHMLEESMLEFKIGTRIEDQQIGCLWQDNNILSVSVSGDINYLDISNPNKPLRVLTGQNKNLTSLAVPPDGSTIYCGSMDGKISYWGAVSGEVNLVGGAGHTNLVCSMVATPESLYSLGFDKNLRKSPTDTNQFLSEVVSIPDRDPTYVARSSDGLIIITTLTEIILVRDGKTVGSLPVSYEPLSAVFHPSRPEVAIGGKDSKVYIYSTENDSLTLKNEIETRGEVNAVDYDPTGKFLAASGYAKVVVVYDTTSYKEVKDFIKQTARVTALKFSQDSKWIISCGIDSNICMYNMDNEKTFEIRGAHPLSVISDIAWINGTTFASCGDDCCIRVWEFTG